MTETYCRKCGTDNAVIRYHKDRHACCYENRNDKGVDREHLHIHCKTCGHSWTEATVDNRRQKQDATK
jgi:uncharacterized Zn finger protein